MTYGEAHNTRLDGKRQDLLKFRNTFNLQINTCKRSLDSKFGNASRDVKK